MFAAPIGVQYILLQKDREQRERVTYKAWNTKKEITVARCRTREWRSKTSQYL